MSQVEGTTTKGREEDLHIGWGEELPLLDQDKKGIQIGHGGNAGIGTPSRHRTKKGAEPIRKKDGLDFESVPIDISKVKRLLCIGVFVPVHSPFAVPVRSQRRGRDTNDGIINLNINEGYKVEVHGIQLIPGTIVIALSTSLQRWPCCT